MDFFAIKQNFKHPTQSTFFTIPPYTHHSSDYQYAQYLITPIEEGPKLWVVFTWYCRYINNKNKKNLIKAKTNKTKMVCMCVYIYVCMCIKLK